MEENTLKMWMPVTKTASGKLVGILSDTSIDRDDEFMTKELLVDWAKNTSLKALANHENKMEKWVGGWSNLKVVEKGGNFALVGEPWFFSKEANPLAEQIRLQVLESIEKGENAGISIGAIPKETMEKTCSDKKKRKGYVKAELLEGTWVPIQSNRNASFGHVAKLFDLDNEGNLTKEDNTNEIIKKITEENNTMVQEEIKVEKEAEVQQPVETVAVVVEKTATELELEKVKAEYEELNKKLSELKLSNENLQKELDGKAVLKATVETKADIENFKKGVEVENVVEPTILNMLKAQVGLLNK